MADPAPRWVRVQRDDATLWVWICYGLIQSVVTMLTAFDVIETFTVSEVVTAVTLVVYVAVNELIVRPRRRQRAVDAAVADAPPLPGPEGPSTV